MPKADQFAAFTTSLEKYCAAMNSVAALAHAHKRHACQGSALPDNFDAKLDDALCAARRAWTTIESLIDPIAAALGFNSAEPVLKLARDFNPAVMIPADTQSVALACEFAPYLHNTLAREIKSLLDRARICPPPPVARAAGETVKPDSIALAVALLKDHPEWSARKLAGQCGCATSTLTRSSLFKKARSLATGKREPRPGSKDASGTIEAVADDD